MIESLSIKVATALKTASGNEKVSIEVVRFGIMVFVNNASIYILCFVFGNLLGHFSEVILALISFSLLRMVSGGFHLKTPLGCITLSVFTMVAIPFIPVTPIINLAMTSISLLLVLLFAPSNIERQTRVPKRYFFVFKILAICITSTNFFFQVNVLALSFFLQAISLIRIGGDFYVQKKTS